MRLAATKPRKMPSASTSTSRMFTVFRIRNVPPEDLKTATHSDRTRRRVHGVSANSQRDLMRFTRSGSRNQLFHLGKRRHGPRNVDGHIDQTTLCTNRANPVWG